MLKDNLKDLKWKCYTQEGIIEINNNRNYDDVEGVEAVLENTNSKVDVKLIDIFEELYYVLALEYINSYENDMDKEILLSHLQQREQRYNAVLRLKQLYYAEVQTSIERINMYCENGACLTNEDADMLREIESLYMDLSERNYRRHWRCPSISYRLAYENLKEFKKLVNALIDLAICYEKRDLKEHDDIITKQWMELFLVFRNREFGIAGELAWLLCLLNAFQRACSEPESYVWTSIELGEYWENQLLQVIEQTNMMVENVLGKKICDVQNEMMCFLIRPMASDIFDSKISSLVNALKQMPKMKRYWDTEGDKCIAIMHSNSKRYVALSGGEAVNKYSVEIKRILGTGYQVVELNSDVRYYYTKQNFIEYKDYKDWKESVKFAEEKVPEARRMFSCCERKLLTELYGRRNVTYTIYVKKKACSMCEMALKDFDLKQSCCGLIKYPTKKMSDKSNRKRKSISAKLDEIAKGVKYGVLPDSLIYSQERR